VKSRIDRRKAGFGGAERRPARFDLSLTAAVFFRQATRVRMRSLFSGEFFFHARNAARRAQADTDDTAKK